MTTKEFLDSAISGVESQSIREWAKSAHNYPIMMQLAEGLMKKYDYAPSQDQIDKFTAWIVAKAIGLID